MKNVTETQDGKFKVGDKVQTTMAAVAAGCEDESFIVKDIICDGFGCVLLKEKDGRGYGEHYLEHYDS